MKITTKRFGKTNKGEEVKLYSLTNDSGMTVTISDYGASIVSIIVPDAKGNKIDVALGFETIEGYEENQTGFGAFIGRHANRIEGAQFTLNNKVFKLESNNGDHNIHGGSPEYSKLMYEVEIIKEVDMLSIECSRLSPDMEQGFPGNLDISITYSLTNDNELIIEYFAVSDQDTLVNLTNHSYFNLSGHDSGLVDDHKLWIKANYFTPTTDDSIPTGELREVSNTPMDFRILKPIGQDIDADYEPLKQTRGYDHNYVLDISTDEVEKVVELIDDKSGRVMEVFTDKPGMQLYTANYLTPVRHGKDGAKYNKRSGVCFETQYFPNACNIESFPSCVLRAEKEYDFVTIFKFSNK